MNCPKCGGSKIMKYGHIHNGKPRFRCKQCGRQFVENPTNRIISREIRQIIDNLLLERISLRGLCRATGVSLTWLQSYVNKKYESSRLEVTYLPKKGKITIECDEICTFVGNKLVRLWIWLAIEVSNRMIVGFWVGCRSLECARALFRSLPPVYRQCAVCHTDGLASYTASFPSTRHKSFPTGRGKTNHIERFNLTLRQRVARLARKTLSFAKKLQNLTGAVLDFINDYNRRIPLPV
jgi:insertion element IS1 protein InsB